MSRSSSREYTAPVGLHGELRISPRVRDVDARAKSSRRHLELALAAHRGPRSASRAPARASRSSSSSPASAPALRRRAEKREARVEQRLLRSRCDDDLVGRRSARPAWSALARSAMISRSGKNPFDLRVSRRAGIERAMRRRHHECGRREIGLARAEVDDGATGGAQRLGARGHGDRRRLAKLGDVCGRRVTPSCDSIGDRNRRGLYFSSAVAILRAVTRPRHNVG